MKNWSSIVSNAFVLVANLKPLKLAIRNLSQTKSDYTNNLFLLFIKNDQFMERHDLNRNSNRISSWKEKKIYVLEYNKSKMILANQEHTFRKDHSETVLWWTVCSYLVLIATNINENPFFPNFCSSHFIFEHAGYTTVAWFSKKRKKFVWIKKDLFWKTNSCFE